MNFMYYYLLLSSALLLGTPCVNFAMQAPQQVELQNIASLTYNEKASLYSFINTTKKEAASAGFVMSEGNTWNMKNELLVLDPIYFIQQRASHKFKAENEPAQKSEVHVYEVGYYTVTLLKYLQRTTILSHLTVTLQKDSVFITAQNNKTFYIKCAKEDAIPLLSQNGKEAIINVLNHQTPTTEKLQALKTVVNSVSSNLVVTQKERTLESHIPYRWYIKLLFSTGLIATAYGLYTYFWKTK